MTLKFQTLTYCGSFQLTEVCWGQKREPLGRQKKSEERESKRKGKREHQ